MHPILSTVRYAFTFAAGGLLSIAMFILLTHICAFSILPNIERKIVHQLNIKVHNEYHYSQMEHELAVASAIINHFPYADNIHQLPFWIVSASEAQGVDPILLTALIAQESSFRSDAVSPVGAIGYGQVIPRYWEDSCGLNVTSAYNNIWCSAYALKTYINQYGSLPKALAMYNVGPGRYREARYRLAGYRYAKSVFSYQADFMGSQQVAISF